MLKIKQGSEIFAYGMTANSFNDKSELSQEILEHLQTRFPDQIEKVETKKVENKKANK